MRQENLIITRKTKEIHHKIRLTETYDVGNKKQAQNGSNYYKQNIKHLPMHPPNQIILQNSTVTYNNKF